MNVIARGVFRAANSATIHLDAAKLRVIHLRFAKGEDVMERRHFLKVAFGIAAGTAAFAAIANAAPLSPVSPVQGLVPSGHEAAEPAVVSQNEVDHLKPEEVRWGHHWHRHHWHHRHWGWHHRWHRHHWHHRHWR